jgi:hypothetical protein
MAQPLITRQRPFTDPERRIEIGLAIEKRRRAVSLAACNACYLDSKIQVSGVIAIVGRYTDRSAHRSKQKLRWPSPRAS